MIWGDWQQFCNIGNLLPKGPSQEREGPPLLCRPASEGL